MLYIKQSVYFMDLLHFTEEDTTNRSIKSAEETSRIASKQEYNYRLSLACKMSFSKSFEFLSGFFNSGVMMLKFLQRA